METTTTPMPTDAQMGSDNRPHHKFGFSFLGTLEKCSAARRTKSAPKNLAAAGERGTELHEVLETAVKRWLRNVEMGSDTPFLLVLSVVAHEMAVSASDARSVMKIGEEIAVYFVNDPDLQVGTEEYIELKHPVTGEVISAGYYDIILILGTRALVIDHKFVRKEVEEAEKNRQGHGLAVSVFQTYPEITQVEVLFSMPECQSSRYTFTRETDLQRLEAELAQITDDAERPDKTLHAGEHCNYCRHCGTCPASVQVLQTMGTAIVPMSAPLNFNPAVVETPEQMALLRYWCATVEPIIEQVKARSLEMAQNGAELRTTLANGESVVYKLHSRAAARSFAKETMDIWAVVKNWMPVNAFIQAAKMNVGSFEKVAIQVLADRLLSEGKKPNLTQIGKDLAEMMVKTGLVMPDDTKISYLKRTKVGVSKALKNVTPSGEGPEDEGDK